jgi:hypothetical protein
MTGQNLIFSKVTFKNNGFNKKNRLCYFFNLKKTQGLYKNADFRTNN